MLPSKGYFKSLNCPYYDNGFCDRPHCHFRHTKKDKAADELQQLENVDQSTQINDILSDVVTGETSSDSSSWVASQHSASSSVKYKPTPIVELKKRHIPITTAPSVTLSSISQKRRLEYDIKGIKKPKVEYIPEAVISDSNSTSSVYPKNVSKAVYRATKISSHPDQLLNGNNTDGKVLLQDPEESEGEIDFVQVSNELNFLDELLKEYEEPNTNVALKNILNVSRFSKVGSKKKEEQEQSKNVSSLLNDKVSNGLLKHSPILSERNNISCPSESDHPDTNQTKTCNDSDQKGKSSQSDGKNKVISDCLNITERSRQKGSISNIKLCDKIERRRSSEHRRNSDDHRKSERDKPKNKNDSETSPSSSKSTKREQGSDSHKLSNSSSLSKREHSCGSKSSNNESEHKSSKPSRKDFERESSSRKPLTKESDRKSSSSKSSKKESDHQCKSSKSSKSESHESSRKRANSPISHSSSKKHKQKTEHKQDDRDSRSSRKYKDENRHRKESNEKRSTKGDTSQNHKENKKRDKSGNQSEDKRKRTHSVSETQLSSDDDDVEIISEPESIIVIDSEEDTNSDSEDRPSSKKRNIEKVESSPSPAVSTGIPTPTFPSDVSDSSDVEDKTQDNTQLRPVPVSNGPSTHSKIQDDASLLDHRVQSRIKNRVSLGTAWRPQTRKPVEIMTPAQRLLLFAKLREQEEKDGDSQSNTGRVKIGCVPNVKLLLQEKERLLKNKSLQPRDVRPNATAPRIQAMDQLRMEEDRDEAPKNPFLFKHPRNKGADIYARRAMLEKLYKYQKQMLEPGRPYKYAQDKCLKEESKIWLETDHDTYEKEMMSLIMCQRAKIPDFTLKNFMSIRPRECIMFPPELRRRPENGVVRHYLTSEDSLYSWCMKYCLTEEELETEGYPRKKTDCSQGRLIAYINKESLTKWKKANGIPPTGEYPCSNCGKFYSRDENGFSDGQWECAYHPKKACRSTREKSGLYEKKARCCGNDISNPCMVSQFHSFETRDMQNLEGFVETKEPKGVMPLEGWGIYALDCEMYWSTRGLELGRVTVVNAEQRTVYDTFVKPEFPVTDYATRMSGLTKENLESAPKRFTEVQNDLLKLFNSKTILIGHSLENDLKTLQIIHGTVVDTAMMFKNGEYKQALKTLASELLKEVIQNEEDGHDSAEDAVTCIKLIKQKVLKDATALARRAPPALRRRYRDVQNN